MTHRTVRIVLSILVSFTAALAPASPAGARDAGRHLVPGLPLYLALGDSVANGQQSAPVVEGDYWATVASWQAHGYVAQFDKYLIEELDCVPGRGPASGPGCRQLQLLNMARSAVPDAVMPPLGLDGLTSAMLIDEQLPDAVALLKARNHDKNPRNDVRVVTITIGGNDLGPIKAACIPTPGAGCGAAIKSTFDTFSANLTTILAALREAAGPTTEIITMTYYNPYEYCNDGANNPVAVMAADLVLEGGSLGGLVLPAGLNDLIRGISGANQAKVADTHGKLGEGDFVGGSDCLHPNLAGHAKIASSFQDAYAN